jgi:hypothetical protein
MRKYAGELLRGAKEDGVLRHDFMPIDLYTLFWSVGNLIEQGVGGDEDWRRIIGFVLAGLCISPVQQSNRGS